MESMFTGFIGLCVGIFIIVCIFILCRELMCWYWKINKSIENQEKIILLLQQLIDKRTETTHESSVPVGSGYESFVGKHVEIIQKNGLKLTGQVVASDTPEEYIALFTNGGILNIKLEFIKDIRIIA